MIFLCLYKDIYLISYLGLVYKHTKGMNGKERISLLLIPLFVEEGSDLLCNSVGWSSVVIVGLLLLLLLRRNRLRIEEWVLFDSIIQLSYILLRQNAVFKLPTVMERFERRSVDGHLDIIGIHLEIDRYPKLFVPC